MTQLWRVHLITKGQDPRRFCIDANIIGIGWPVDHEGAVDWLTYNRLASAQYKPGGRAWQTAINAFYHKMKKDDLCWTRDGGGCYFLGKVDSEWRYENDHAHREAQVVNVRTAIWIEVGTAEQVPGTVIRQFIKGPTVRRIADQTTLAVSQMLYNERTSKCWYEPVQVDPDLYALLDPWDFEKLAGIYLQAVEDYMIVPGTGDKSAPKYEFVLIHRGDGRRAALQVKSGRHQSINIGEYVEVAERFDQFYLFTPSGQYLGDQHPKIRCLLPEEIMAFAESNRHRLPSSVQVCLDRARSLKIS